MTATWSHHMMIVHAAPSMQRRGDQVRPPEGWGRNTLDRSADASHVSGRPASVVFGANRHQPNNPTGPRMPAHELTHVLQQRAGAPLVIQRQQPTAPAAPGTDDAVRHEVEELLKTFAAASSYEDKNRVGMQAVRAVIRAYGMSTRGLAGMRYVPKLTKGVAAHTVAVGDKRHTSNIEFGPSSFNQGFEWLVHATAHELEHVRQELIGGYGAAPDPTSEFLAYAGEVVQVANTPGLPGRGFLGSLIAGGGTSAPPLPALPPDILEEQGRHALDEFLKMPPEQQRRLRQEAAGVRDKLFERLTNEAPPALRPPVRFTPQWDRWFDGRPPTDDSFTFEFQDWMEANRTPWHGVKDLWKDFDRLFRG